MSPRQASSTAKINSPRFVMKLQQGSPLALSLYTTKLEGYKELWRRRGRQIVALKKMRKGNSFLHTEFILTKRGLWRWIGQNSGFFVGDILEYNDTLWLLFSEPSIHPNGKQVIMQVTTLKLPSVCIFPTWTDCLTLIYDIFSDQSQVKVYRKILNRALVYAWI